MGISFKWHIFALDFFANNTNIVKKIMTKVELVKEIAKQTGVDQATVLVVVEGMMQTIKDSLVRKENIFLRGFGTFALKHRAEKTARDISKNTSIIVPAHDIPSFKPCRDFMDDVAGVAPQPASSAAGE